ncbi:MAG: UPF0175 family protein [Thermodesulfobacteriota bacterium]|nr:UPF0175 family protein [Thermodesulfobacteriota bacterium]
MLFQHAIQLYRKHKLSLGKAAELAGYTRLGFIRKLKAKMSRSLITMKRLLMK